MTKSEISDLRLLLIRNTSGSPDSTFAGSRSGFTPVILWNYLAKHSYEKQIKMALDCEKMANYAFEQLKTVEASHKDLGLYVERSPLSLTVRFRKPNDQIIFKYSLSCETLEVDGEKKALCTLVCNGFDI